MWFLWLPLNGWAPFVSIILYNLWIVWHGWCAEKKKKGILWHFYGAEIPFRVFSTILHLTVFPWVFRFNPSPWAPQMTMTTAPAPFVNFIVFKLLIEGIMILLLADILLNFKIVKKILLLEESKRTRTGHIVSTSLLFGLIFWILSGLADYLFYKDKVNFLLSLENPTLADFLILKVPLHELFIRIIYIFTCVIAGVIVAKRISRHRESKELYRSLVENINLGITLIDQDHNIVMANKAQGKMLNKAPSEFCGEKCYDEFEKRDHVCPHCPGVAAMKEGAPKEVITQGQRDDGSTITVNIKAFPLQAENRLQKGFIEVVEDISEQLKTEQDLAAEKERLAVTLRSIGDGVITTDISGTILLLNKVAENLTGWSNKEAVGLPLQEVFHIIDKQTREECENPVENIIHSGKYFGPAKDIILVAKNGKELSVGDNGSPILDANDDIVGVVIVFRDITEQIKTEKELLKIKKLESIGLLAGGIAHDFNNILAAILGNVNLAALDPNLLPDTKKLLDEAEKASLRAKGLTQQLLTFAKGGEPVTETASLESVIKDSANFVLHGDKVVCHYNIPKELWLVDIDKGQMSQVIQNIVLNASHAMPEGGTIQVSCKNSDALHEEKINLPCDKKFVELTITDSGIGIPANLIEKIFDPYFSTKQEGSGLGLAISHSIINKHNGHVAVKSVPGFGTTFILYIPASAYQQEKEKRDELIEGKGGHNKARIMVMDDEEQIRDIAKSMLSKIGHEVLLVRDGVEALKLYKEYQNSNEKIDIVIMDLTIPGGMGGQDAVQEVLAIDPDATVIVSSGYSNDPIMANCQEYGFCAAIAKPYQFKELARVVNQVMRLGSNSF